MRKGANGKPSVLNTSGMVVSSKQKRTDKERMAELNCDGVMVATPAGSNLALRLPPDVTPALGDALALQPDPAHTHLFGADGQSLAPADGPLFTASA